jgi:hypothetical protein
MSYMTFIVFFYSLCAIVVVFARWDHGGSVAARNPAKDTVLSPKTDPL